MFIIILSWIIYIIDVGRAMSFASDPAYKFHAFDLLIEHSTDVLCHGVCLAQATGSASNPPNVYPLGIKHGWKILYK